jgi:MFS transporter, MCT family, aspergillic acid transporter
MAYGILSTGSSIGGVVFPIMVNRVIASVGYPWAMRSCGFLVLFLLIIANLTVRALHPPSPRELSPSQMAKPFKEVGFLGLLAGMFLLTFGIYTPVTYLPTQAVASGMSVDLAQYLVAILNAAR